MLFVLPVTREEQLVWAGELGLEAEDVDDDFDFDELNKKS